MDMIKTITLAGNKTARNRRNTGSSQLHLRLELSFLNSYDMAMLKEKYSIAGWGVAIYMMKFLLERRTNCRAPLYAISEIAHGCHKSPKFVLQLINDFPSLFQIESNKKVFYSPFLQQLFGECSARNEETNDGLEKLTNRHIDNQSLSLPKNKELKQEQRTTKEKKRKPSPNPSQGGEFDADEGCLMKNSDADATLKYEEVDCNVVATSQTSPTEGATKLHEAGVSRELLAKLYQDNDYMMCLERIGNLAVRTNCIVRRNLLFWFYHYCQSHGKLVRDEADAKDYLSNLMRPGSNTRAQFMAYQNKIYAIEWEKKHASGQENNSKTNVINPANGYPQSPFATLSYS